MSRIICAQTATDYLQEMKNYKYSLDESFKLSSSLFGSGDDYKVVQLLEGRTFENSP